MPSTKILVFRYPYLAWKIQPNLALCQFGFSFMPTFKHLSFPGFDPNCLQSSYHLYPSKTRSFFSPSLSIVCSFLNPACLKWHPVCPTQLYLEVKINQLSFIMLFIQYKINCESLCFVWELLDCYLLMCPTTICWLTFCLLKCGIKDCKSYNWFFAQIWGPLKKNQRKKYVG